MYGQQDDSPPQDDSPQQHEAQDVEDYCDSGEMQVDPDGEVFTQKSGMTFGKARIVDFTGKHIYFNDGGSDIQTSGETTDDEAPPLHAGSAVLTRTEMQERMSTLRDPANGGTAYTNTDSVWWGEPPQPPRDGRARGWSSADLQVRMRRSWSIWEKNHRFR